MCWVCGLLRKAREGNSEANFFGLRLEHLPVSRGKIWFKTKTNSFSSPGSDPCSVKKELNCNCWRSHCSLQPQKPQIISCAKSQLESEFPSRVFCVQPNRAHWTERQIHPVEEGVPSLLPASVLVLSFCVLGFLVSPHIPDPSSFVARGSFLFIGEASGPLSGWRQLCFRIWEGSAGTGWPVERDLTSC